MILPKSQIKGKIQKFRTSGNYAVKLDSTDSLGILDIMKVLSKAGNFTKQMSNENNHEFSFGPSLSTIEGNKKVRHFEYPLDKLSPIDKEIGQWYIQ